MTVVLTIYLVMSLVTFVAYGRDKRAAVRGRRRTPERTLHLLALLGGVAGALAGQQVFRHKRRKTGFTAVTILLLLVHVAAWIAWIGIG